MSGDGFLDGRYMAATFNLLRGRDLIWNYVVNNYLLGEDYPPFDLLHWNGDITNLPAKWHKGYLSDLYRDNRLVEPGAMAIGGTPIDLTTVKTPTYVQAGREDHIAPAESVWKITDHFTGPLKFVLAGSGHIAGVVNPPAARKYQYWTNDKKAGEPGRVRRRRDRDEGQLVAGLARMARGSGRQARQGDRCAGSRQGQVEGDRGCAGALRPPAIEPFRQYSCALHKFYLEPNCRLPYVAVQQKTPWETYRWQPSLRLSLQRRWKRQRPLPSSRR